MSEHFSENKKFVKNQLFSAAVTGNTIEDYSQNVVLLPATNLPTGNSGKSPVGAFSNSPSVGHITWEPQQPTAPPSNTEGLFFTSTSTISIGGATNTTPENYSNLESVPLFQGPGPTTGASFLNIGQTFQTAVQPSSSIPQNTLDLTNILAPIPTSSGLTTTISGNYTSLDSVPLCDTVGKKTDSFTSHPPSATKSLSSTTGTTKNLYRRSGITKPSYAQVPGFLNPTCIENKNPSPVLEPNSISSSNSYPGISLTPTNNFPTSHNYNSQPFPSVQTTTPQTVPFAEFEVLKPSKSSSPTVIKPADFHNSFNSNNKNSSPTPLGLFSQETFSNHSLNSTPSSILSPVTETNNQSPEMLLTDAYSNGYGVFPNTQGFTTQRCRPVYHHWFFKIETESRITWHPFSMMDSLALEEAFVSLNLNPETTVATDGGRFDVNLLRRERYPIYWSSAPIEVRRCSWFYKGHSDGRFTPFEENIATLLEERYTNAFETNIWNIKIELSNGESLVMVGPDVLLLFPTSQIPDLWDTDKSQTRPKVVKRGMDEFNIDEGEPTKIDHLLLLVHGIGSACDLKFRTVEQVVDEFRNIATQLLNSHYQTSCNSGVVHRIEVLPISWHNKLHSEDTGIDTKLKNITLSSIPRLREFTNDTLLDILLYTSPRYCQTIITSVGNELNRVYELFKKRNPAFEGNVSLGGHSLGSLILFDLLCHQNSINILQEGVTSKNVTAGTETVQHEHVSRRLSTIMSEAGSGQLQLLYPNLNFHPTALFALGSPIGMFLTIRGLEKLGDEFSFPTCSKFLNIYHPYDPVAYRIEPLVNVQLTNLKPVLIPHHKGRKRMHLALKDTMSKVGADLKDKLIDSVKTTWNTLFQVGMFTKPENDIQNSDSEIIAHQEADELHYQNIEEQNISVNLGKLNNGHRIDYVLQEAPFEILNEYIFALTSHMCYWESEDTILLILKEIYNSMGIASDSKEIATQQIVASDIPLLQTAPGVTPTVSNQKILNRYPTSAVSRTTQLGMDPTMPISSNINLGPPPTAGFFRTTS